MLMTSEAESIECIRLELEFERPPESLRPKNRLKTGLFFILSMERCLLKSVSLNRFSPRLTCRRVLEKIEVKEMRMMKVSGLLSIVAACLLLLGLSASAAAQGHGRGHGGGNRGGGRGSFGDEIRGPARTEGERVGYRRDDDSRTVFERERRRRVRHGIRVFDNRNITFNTPRRVRRGRNLTPGIPRGLGVARGRNRHPGTHRGSVRRH